MTYDDARGTSAGSAPPGTRARRVSTSRSKVRPRRPGRGRGGRRKAPQPGKVVLKVILASLLTLGLTTGVGVVLVYNNWNDNLQHQDLAAQLGEDRPAKEEVEGPKEPMNILVMGSDTRDCKGCRVDGESGGGLSDTTIMFHISADRKFAYAISVPRDTLVDRPECYRKDKSVIPAADAAQWNSAYAAGGPACTVRQFEQLSGIRIDHHIVIDFGGFKDMVNALDGVEVCIPEDIEDEEHGITLKAGTREIRGREALSYVRVRHVGDGTDPQRIKRQQAFMAAMISKAVSNGMLARPDRLIGFLNATTSSLKTDFENIGQMGDFAKTLQSIGLDNISFVTTPWVYSSRQRGRVEWTSEVNKLWRLARRDRQLTAEFLDDSISAGRNTDGSPSGGGAGQPSDENTDKSSDKATDDTTGDASDGATDGATDEASDGASPGMSQDARDQALLC